MSRNTYQKILILIFLVQIAPTILVPSARAESVYALSENGTLRMGQRQPCVFLGPCPITNWVDIDRRTQSISLAATRSTLFKLYKFGEIWMWLGRPCQGSTCESWLRIGNNAQTTAITGNERNLFQLRRNGSVWRWKGQPCAGNNCNVWERLDNNRRTRAIVAGGSQLVQLHDTGEIWRWQGQPCDSRQCFSWERLDNNRQTVEIAAASPGNLYQRHTNGSVWKWDGLPCSGNSCPHWSLIDNNPNTVKIAAAPGELFQMHENGNVWRWQGRACQDRRCPFWTLLENDGTTSAIAAGKQINSNFPPLYRVTAEGQVQQWPGVSCTAGVCRGWPSRSTAFTSYNQERGGLFVFEGEHQFAEYSSRGLAPEDFGFDTRRFARSSDGTIELNILMMMTSYEDTDFGPGQDEAFYRKKYFGRFERLESYYRENSPDIDFNINLVKIIRVRDERTLPCAHRWIEKEADSPGGLSQLGCDSGTDGKGHTTATVEQIESLNSDQVIDLAEFDKNGDNKIYPHELIVINMQGIPDRMDGYLFDDTAGNRFSLPRCARLVGTRKEICGSYLNVADDTNFLTFAHEMGHFLGTDDIYGNNSNNYMYSIMAGTATNNEEFVHFDPWHKIKLGFAKPRIIEIPTQPTPLQSLRLHLPTSRVNYEPLIFYHPAKGAQEYFILEYRKNTASAGADRMLTHEWDQDAAGSGLVIWFVRTRHGTTDLANINTFMPGGSAECKDLEGLASTIIGAPSQNLTRGSAWQRANGEIMLRWPGPDQLDTGLRLQVKSDTSNSTLDVDWWTERPANGPSLLGRRRSTVELGVNRPGFDFCSFNVRRGGNVEYCRQECDRDWRCLAYTWVLSGTRGGTSRCFLKFGVPGAQAVPGMVSGVKP